jgi:hypothetical protein
MELNTTGKNVKPDDFVRVPFFHVYSGWPVYLTMDSYELPKYSGFPNTGIGHNDLVYTLAKYTTDYNPA